MRNGLGGGVFFWFGADGMKNGHFVRGGGDSLSSAGGPFPPGLRVEPRPTPKAPPLPCHAAEGLARSLGPDPMPLVISPCPWRSASARRLDSPSPSMRSLYEKWHPCPGVWCRYGGIGIPLVFPHPFIHSLFVQPFIRYLFIYSSLANALIFHSRSLLSKFGILILIIIVAIVCSDDAVVIDLSMVFPPNNNNNNNKK